MKLRVFFKVSEARNQEDTCLSLSDVVFILLINVKMPTIVGNFNIYEQDKEVRTLRGYFGPL